MAAHGSAWQRGARSVIVICVEKGSKARDPGGGTTENCPSRFARAPSQVIVQGDGTVIEAYKPDGIVGGPVDRLRNATAARC